MNVRRTAARDLCIGDKTVSYGTVLGIEHIRTTSDMVRISYDSNTVVTCRPDYPLAVWSD